MQNRTFLVLLRPIFCEKLKIVPPHRKTAPLKRLDFRIWPKNQSQFRSKPFFFFFWRPPDFGPKKRLNFQFRPKNQSQLRWRPLFYFYFLETTLILGRKNVWISDFGRKISLNFGEDLFFFFLETTWIWAEKTFEFPSFPRNFVSIFGQTVWNWFKNNENSGQGRLHFSHSFKIAPPFPNPGYAPGLVIWMFFCLLLSLPFPASKKHCFLRIYCCKRKCG